MADNTPIKSIRIEEKPSSIDMPTKSPTNCSQIEIGIGIRTPILSKKAQDIK